MTSRTNKTMGIEYPWTDEEIKPLDSLSETTLDKRELETDSLKPEYKMEIVWRNVFLMSYFHLAALYGLYLTLSFQSRIITFLFNYVFAILSGFGTTAGAHRLWAHKAYKVKTPLKLILIFLQTSCIQNSIYVWCRDHRVHHKYTETDADPHNAKRGFFFAHVGWLLVKKHPDVNIKGKTIDMSDLTSDPLIMFQHKYYLILSLLLGLALPTWFGWFILGDTFSNAYHVAVFRYILILHSVWCVNSLAHLYGSHPYDASINPAENSFVGWCALGEGWHNYHHTFPWDYRTSELSPSKRNFTTRQIDRFARIGWAYDLKTVPKAMLMQRVERTGDGTYEEPPVNTDHKKDHVHSGPWGWGDPDTPVESTKLTQILFPQKQRDKSR